MAGEAMTDEELTVIRATWHKFRRVELYRGDPDGERKLTDELLNHMPALLAEVERLRRELFAAHELLDEHHIQR